MFRCLGSRGVGVQGLGFRVRAEGQASEFQGQAFLVAKLRLAAPEP